MEERAAKKTSSDFKMYAIDTLKNLLENPVHTLFVECCYESQKSNDEDWLEFTLETSS